MFTCCCYVISTLSFVASRCFLLPNGNMNAFPKYSIQSFKGSPVTLVHDLFVRCCCEIQYNIKHVSSSKKSRYVCRLCASGGWKATAKGANKKQAKAAAAQQLLEIILGQHGEKNELSGNTSVSLPDGCEPPEKVLDALHRICEGRRLPPPHFILCESLMNQRPFNYKVECRILDKGLVGFGRNKKQAKRHAAMRMLLYLLLESWLCPSSTQDQNSPRSDDEVLTNEYIDSELEASEDEKNLLLSAKSKDEGGDRLLIRCKQVPNSPSKDRKIKEEKICSFRASDYRNIGFDYSILQPVEDGSKICEETTKKGVTRHESLEDLNESLKSGLKIPERSSYEEFQDNDRFHDSHLPCLVRESSLERSPCLLESSGDAGCFWAALDDEFRKYLWWSQNNKPMQQEINNLLQSPDVSLEQNGQCQDFSETLPNSWSTSEPKSGSSCTDISTTCIENELNSLSLEEPEIKVKEDLDPKTLKEYSIQESFECKVEDEFTGEHLLNVIFYELLNFRRWLPCDEDELSSEEDTKKQMESPVDYRRLKIAWRRFYSLVLEEAADEEVGELPLELFPVADSLYSFVCLWKKLKVQLEPAEEWIQRLSVVQRVLQVCSGGLFLIFLVYYCFTDEVSNGMFLLTFLQTALIIYTSND